MTGANAWACDGRRAVEVISELAQARRRLWLVTTGADEAAHLPALGDAGRPGTPSAPLPTVLVALRRPTGRPSGSGRGEREARWGRAGFSCEP